MTHYRTCPLCEATCGLELTVDGAQVTGVRGDAADVFSAGFICPKGAALGELHHDPDRLGAPMIRHGERWTEVDWDTAFAEVQARLLPIVKQHGRDAVAAYLGNPNVHNLAGMVYGRSLLKALSTRNLYTASTVDQMPKHVSSGLLFGLPQSIPVPDLDRTDYLLMLGANPLVSNGSLCTAPDFPGRLKALQRRGGRYVVVDPRRSRTAAKADEHVFIRPGGDALLLFALVQQLFAEDRVSLGRLGQHVIGVDAVAELAEPFTPSAVSAACGVPAATITRLARELTEAPRAAVYGRIGTTTVAFGTLTSWLVDVLNVLTGNLDRAGGAMFARSVASRYRPGRAPGGRGFQVGRWHSRVRQLPEVRSELPAATLADEIEAEGNGQVRALVTVAGNPVLSTPNGDRLDRALAGLDFMVSVDPYLNETTRHAHVILPAPSPLERGHCDLAFYDLSIRNVVNYSPPLFPPKAGLDESDILLRLTAICLGLGHDTDLDALDDQILSVIIGREVGDRGSPLHGRSSNELRDALSGHRRAERVLDFMLRAGPYGDGFGQRPDGLTLDSVSAAPHGVDLGPLQPQIPEILHTPSGKIELAPEWIVGDVPRLHKELDHRSNGGLVLVGRRQLRSNNSWMHNIGMLVRGKPRCTLQIHPDDAAPLDLQTGSTARVSSRVGDLEALVEVTSDVAPGVVSLPHGWGHDLEGARLRVAAEHAGVNSNVLTDELAVDPLSGNAVLNGIPVEVAAA